MAPPTDKEETESRTGIGAMQLNDWLMTSVEPLPVHTDRANTVVARQLRVRLPKGVWSSQISRKHPDTLFEITNWEYWDKGRTLADVLIYHPGTWDCVKELSALKDIFQVEHVNTRGSTQRLCVVHKTPIFSECFKRFGVMQKTPIRIRNGISTWEVVGTDERINKLIKALRKLSIAVVLDPLSRNSERSGLVIDRGGSRTIAIPLPVEKTGLGHLAVCKLRLHLQPPYWHSLMATRHPETSIDVIGYSLMDDGMLVDIRVHTNNFPEWIEELRSFPDVHDVRVLGRGQNATTARVIYRGNEVFADICRLHLILRVPFTIKDGVTDVVMAGPDGSIKRFVSMFPKLKPEVEAVYEAEKEKESLLTRRQAYVFRCAWAAGYFEVPRHVTLTELAARMGVAVSSLSEMLAVVEKKLLQESQASV
jgi:hypothetical protein